MRFLLGAVLLTLVKIVASSSLVATFLLSVLRFLTVLARSVGPVAFREEAPGAGALGTAPGRRRGLESSLSRRVKTHGDPLSSRVFLSPTARGPVPWEVDSIEKTSRQARA
jgi:hypothetical protein